MTFSWKELVCHGLLVRMGDPSLVKELLKVVVREHRDHLDEEARVYHSEITKENLIYNLTMTIPSRCGRLRDRILERKLEAAEFGNSIRIHRDVTDELLASWQERKPYRRRDSTWVSLLGGNWDEQCDLLNNGWVEDPPSWKSREEEGLISYTQEDVAKCEWFQEIHEGRYYLFWHKESFIQASHFTHWSVTASIDINVVEGRTEENPWGSQAWGDICWDPKYLREKPNERKHIDDMFLQE